MSLKSLLAPLAALALMASFVPALAFAQTYPYNYCNSSYSGNYQNCMPGNLLVYMQVLNQNNGIAGNPGNFTVTVSGTNPTPASFPGSQSGTQVSVGGSYSVTALPLQGYTATYSVGCTGTLANNQQATCVITENNAYSYYSPYPTPYPYNYAPQPLVCLPQTQTVNLGATATFTAEGGDASQYNWQTPTRSFLNIGQTLNVAFTQTGTQTVTVTNGTQTANCMVNVVPGGAPVPVGAYVNPYQTQPQAYVTPTYYPALPNTGFEPQNGAEIAFAVAVLLGFGLIMLPYVRKAFAIVLR
ncbi:MAG: hypothetical protein KGH79_01065 [Patescibacteria group bacterium]|nr:hypothetical protein [Patescibacteria group bacterium]